MESTDLQFASALLLKTTQLLVSCNSRWVHRKIEIFVIHSLWIKRNQNVKTIFHGPWKGKEKPLSPRAIPSSVFAHHFFIKLSLVQDYFFYIDCSRGDILMCLDGLLPFKSHLWWQANVHLYLRSQWQLHYSLSGCYFTESRWNDVPSTPAYIYTSCFLYAKL